MKHDLVPGRMGRHVKVGASVPMGVPGCRLLTDLKLGNILLTLLPMDKDEALGVARYCRENHIYFIFSELLYRGSYDLCWAARKKMPRQEFYSRHDLDEICQAGGEYYAGRITVGEIGALLYDPISYWMDRAAGEWEALPAVETVDEAKEVYLAEIRKWLKFEREDIGGGPYWDTDAGCTFKYHLEAGVDFPLLETMPGDYTLMTAAIRGAAKTYNKPWGTHIAMACYGGVGLDRLWMKRWKISLYTSFLSGSDFVYPESGHISYDQAGKEYPFNSPMMREVRRILREFNQFSQIHSRPADGPKVRLGFVYGNLDGYSGLWNKCVWGQAGDEKWLFGPAEWGWEYLDDIYRKGNWDNENLQGDTDFYGSPPYGQYDLVPIEAPLEVLRSYSCLVFLGWNTMTAEIYEKLKAYAEAGGHLFMSVPHLSTEVDRGKPFNLYNNGDWRDLFGVVVKGKGKAGVAGVKTFNHSTIPSYKMPVWRTRTDPRFIGNIIIADTELHGARVISGRADYYFTEEKELLEAPVLTEFTLGEGKAFLLNSWAYPGDKGWSLYARELLRIISAGEQGDVRVIGSDRIRYAVYESAAPNEKETASRIRTVYLLNTEYDTSHLVNLWISGRICSDILIKPTEMQVVYIRDGVALIPDDRGVEIGNWETDESVHSVVMYCRKDTNARVFNLDDTAREVELNGNRVIILPGDEKSILLNKMVDPDREEFYDEDFLEEPEDYQVQRPASVGNDLPWCIDGLPY